MKKKVTIVIVTAAIIVLISILAVFLVSDKNKSKNDSATSTQMTDQKGQKASKTTGNKVENISIEAPNKDNSSVGKDVKKSSSKSDKKSSKDGGSSKKDGNIKDKGSKDKKSSSQKGLPIDWFDE